MNLIKLVSHFTITSSSIRTFHVVFTDIFLSPCNTNLKHTLGANNITRTNLTRNAARASSPNSNSQRLERSLRTVVVVITIRTANVQSHVRSLRETLQTVGDHLSAQVTNLLALEAEVNDCPGTAGEIDHGPGEGLVEGCVAAAEAGERLAGAEGLGECCAQGQEGIFGGVVVID